MWKVITRPRLNVNSVLWLHCYGGGGGGGGGDYTLHLIIKPRFKVCDNQFNILT